MSHAFKKRGAVLPSFGPSIWNSASLTSAPLPPGSWILSIIYAGPFGRFETGRLKRTWRDHRHPSPVLRRGWPVAQG